VAVACVVVVVVHAVRLLVDVHVVATLVDMAVAVVVGAFVVDGAFVVSVPLQDLTFVPSAVQVLCEGCSS